MDDDQKAPGRPQPELTQTLGAMYGHIHFTSASMHTRTEVLVGVAGIFPDHPRIGVELTVNMPRVLQDETEQYTHELLLGLGKWLAVISRRLGTFDNWIAVEERTLPNPDVHSPVEIVLQKSTWYVDDQGFAIPWESKATAMRNASHDHSVITLDLSEITLGAPKKADQGSLDTHLFGSLLAIERICRDQSYDLVRLRRRLDAYVSGSQPGETAELGTEERREIESGDETAGE